MKRDDASLDPSTQAQVRSYADLLLKKACAYGRFPTPVKDLVAAAKLEVARENALDAVYLGGLYRQLPNWMKLAPDRLKKALEKVVGLLDRGGRTIHLDADLHPKKIPFVTIHEVGHDVLPWQRKTFDIMEDSKAELDPDTHDRYEREANCFSSDVLFQLDRFTTDAADCAFGLNTAIALSRQYGTSVYSTFRRYVATNERACTLLVFDKTEVQVDSAPAISLRRFVASPSFIARFGNVTWPATAKAGSFFFANKPIRKFTSPTPCSLTDVNGDRVDSIVEAFDSSYEIFFLIHAGVESFRRSVFAVGTK